jgi:hypothetical protein
MEPAQYTFHRRTLDIPEGIDRRKTFEASSWRHSLQLASDYWFGGSQVATYILHQGGVITLLSSSGTDGVTSANVIGTIVES